MPEVSNRHGIGTARLREGKDLVSRWAFTDDGYFETGSSNAASGTVANVLPLFDSVPLAAAAIQVEAGRSRGPGGAASPGGDPPGTLWPASPANGEGGSEASDDGQATTVRRRPGYLEPDRKIVEASPRLLSTNNTYNKPQAAPAALAAEAESTVRYEVRPCRCKSRFCEHCCRAEGLKLRERLLPVLRTFTNIQMWTFTIDPSLFSSPQAAYEYVKKKRCISEAVRALKARGYLHSGRWFCVVEWQKDTEMAHFHLLLDASYIPFEAVCEIWGRFRPKTAGPVEGNRPAFGSIRFSQGDFVGGAEHAAAYACKYVIKHPEHGYPDWVINGRHGQIHRYTTSRGFWGTPRRQDTDVPSLQQHPTTCDCKECRETSEVMLPDGSVGLREVLSARYGKSVRVRFHDATCFCEFCRGEAQVPELPKRKQKATIGERLAACRKQAVALTVTEVIRPDGEIIERREFAFAITTKTFDEIVAEFGVERLQGAALQLTTSEFLFLRDREGAARWKASQEERKSHEQSSGRRERRRAVHALAN